jgi:alpha-mannosidase
LRLRLRTTVEFQSQDGSGTPIGGIYVREHTLVAGEPFLRMSVTGAAPLTSDGQPNGESNWQGNPYAVMLRFPFADPQTGDAAAVATMTYGTPYHWVTQMPEPYWSAPIFQATHNFVLPQTVAATIAGIYHADIPAWAIDAQGAVIGCVLRNTPQDQVDSHGANGSDTGTHTHHYALRVPTALQDPASAQPLREALSFQTPLQVAYGNATPNLPFPSSFSLAQVTSGPAILTAAKAGEADPAALVLRVYQPTNNPGGVAPSVTIDLSDFAGTASLHVQRITALEVEIAGENDLPTQNASVIFLAERAITTLHIQTAP